MQVHKDQAQEMWRRHLSSTIELQYQQLRALHEMRNEHLAKQHASEWDNQLAYSKKAERELRKKHVLELKEHPKSLRVHLCFGFEGTVDFLCSTHHTLSFSLPLSSSPLFPLCPHPQHGHLSYSITPHPHPPPPLQSKELAIKKQYHDTVRIQQRQYKALQKQMMATLPKERQRDVLRQTKEEQMRKIAMLAMQYERTITDMAQQQTVRAPALCGQL